MDNERSKKFESVYSNKVKAGKRRTYFFDVRQTKGDDYYVTITESTRRFNGNGYERHKIFLYKEDFNRFLDGLEDVVNHIKSDLMPEYDYDEFTRKHEEYEAQQEAEGNVSDQDQVQEVEEKEESIEEPASEETETIESEEDMSW